MSRPDTPQLGPCVNPDCDSDDGCTCPGDRGVVDAGTADLPTEVRWAVEFTCCGRDDGAQVCATWDAADQFRESYAAGRSGSTVAPHGYSSAPTEPGHVRSGRLYRVAPETRLGYHNAAPEPVSSSARAPLGRVEALPHEDWCCGGGCSNTYHLSCPADMTVCGCFKADVQRAIAGDANPEATDE